MEGNSRVVGFGRYKNLTYEHLWQIDRGYCMWFHNSGKAKLGSPQAEAFWKWIHTKIEEKRYSYT